MTGRAMEVAFEETHYRKTLALADIVKKHWHKAPNSLLVVGCGTGGEAGVLARHFRIDTTGIDIGDEFSLDRQGAAPAKLEIMDAHAMTFPDGSFDFVYSFHALEHMTDPDLALREMARVLKPGGVYVVGTPNKARLLGYIGSATPLKNKIAWNMNDWSARIRGQWRNDLGAHAGFTEEELMKMCSTAFEAAALSITDEYYTVLFGANFVQTLKRLSLTRAIYPCVYALGHKKG
jgi:ubiquinone/menaquinone biosynthesis C-methylase UbiE